MDYRTIILTGLKSSIVLNSVKIAIEENRNFKISPEYEVSNTALRVLKLIVGLSGLKNIWEGVND
jgi:hypothetical protein